MQISYVEPHSKNNHSFVDKELIFHCKQIVLHYLLFEFLEDCFEKYNWSHMYLLHIVLLKKSAIKLNRTSVQ